MSAVGRPRRVTTGAIVEAGAALTLPEVTVRGVAMKLGVSEMSIYRAVSNLAGLRDLVAEGIVERADFSLDDVRDPEDALVAVARRLRAFVRDNPGIASHLANLGPRTPRTVARIEEAQAAFAERYGASASQASVLLSTVAEHAVALAAVDPRSHREARDPETVADDFPTVRAGARATAALSPEERFEWSIRATIRGAMSMLGLPARTDAPLGSP
ncbi:MAG: TetR/AcrR family transcriptional regulator [Microbacterium sp.]